MIKCNENRIEDFSFCVPPLRTPADVTLGLGGARRLVNMHDEVIAGK
jgi:hypothetical protein